MIYDFRLYTLKPGSTPDYMAGVREVGLPIRQRHGVDLAGWYYSDIGGLNQVVHVWGYQDLKHMKEAKAAFYGDPEWREKYLPRAQPLVEAQQTWLMNSPDFAPVYPGDGAKAGDPRLAKQTEMVFDFRQYTFKPGALPQYMSAVEEVGIPVRKRHGVKLAGWFYSEIGELNQVVHIWSFDNVKHMIEAKDAVASDPDWNNEYRPRVGGLLEAQNTYLMKTSDFGPIPA